MCPLRQPIRLSAQDLEMGSSCIVADSVENHLLELRMHEYYAGASLTGVIWTL